MNSDDLKRPLPITGDTDCGTLGDEGLAAAARICASVYEPATVNALDSVYGSRYIDADKLDRLFRQLAERSNPALVPVMFDLVDVNAYMFLDGSTNSYAQHAFDRVRDSRNIISPDITTDCRKRRMDMLHIMRNTSPRRSRSLYATSRTISSNRLNAL